MLMRMSRKMFASAQGALRGNMYQAVAVSPLSHGLFHTQGHA
jgi:hypothetical protein